MTIDWDPIRSLYVAMCHRCTDNTTTHSQTDAYDWATAHDCDPELAALLAEVTSGIAA